MLEAGLRDELCVFQIHMKAWLKHNFPNATSDQQLKGVMEELGELCHSDLKQEQGIRGDEDHDFKIKDAVGDIFIYLLNYCNKKNIDLDECIDIAYTEVRGRDWRKYKETGRYA